MPQPAPPQALSPERVPEPVRALLERLAGDGHPSVLVGGCVRDLVERRPVRDFDVATPAPVERVLELFPRAIPIGLRHGTVMIPTAAGPVDVTRFRSGPELADDLAHRDFTLNALAWSPGSALLDEHGGLADLAAGRLRAVGDPDARLSEDPLRALRAARLVAERGFHPDEPLEAAMAQAAPFLRAVAGERLRAELERVLLGAHAGRGLQLLERTGIQRELAPGVSEHAVSIVEALPRRRDERLAGWLIGTPVRRILARLRFSNATVTRLSRILDAHPAHLRTHAHRPPAIRRLLHRFEPDDVELLLTLAAAEAEARELPEAAAQVIALREAIEDVRADESLALQRGDLALDGSEIMRLLGVGPGPEVGEALRYLTDCVLDDPAENNPDRLRAKLSAWANSKR